MSKTVMAGIGASVVVVAAAGFLWMTASDADAVEITVHQVPTCGCCHLWGEHLVNNGFSVTVDMIDNSTALKERFGIPAHLAACHTAEVDGYIIEGHVPAEDILRLLAERPDVKGLTVPGMPAGSPGMERPVRERYNVLTFDAEGNTEIWARH